MSFILFLESLKLERAFSILSRSGFFLITAIAGTPSSLLSFCRSTMLKPAKFNPSRMRKLTCVLNLLFFTREIIFDVESSPSILTEVERIPSTWLSSLLRTATRIALPFFFGLKKPSSIARTRKSFFNANTFILRF